MRTPKTPPVKPGVTNRLMCKLHRSGTRHLCYPTKSVLKCVNSVNTVTIIALCSKRRSSFHNSLLGDQYMTMNADDIKKLVQEIQAYLKSEEYAATTKRQLIEKEFGPVVAKLPSDAGGVDAN